MPAVDYTVTVVGGHIETTCIVTLPDGTTVDAVLSAEKK